MKTYFVYGDRPYRILGTVEASCETNPGRFPGAQEKATQIWGKLAEDVVLAGPSCRPRVGDLPRTPAN